MRERTLTPNFQALGQGRAREQVSRRHIQRRHLDTPSRWTNGNLREKSIQEEEASSPQPQMERLHLDLPDKL